VTVTVRTARRSRANQNPLKEGGSRSFRATATIMPAAQSAMPGSSGAGRATTAKSSAKRWKTGCCLTRI
jgi:hypothetical protein